MSDTTEFTFEQLAQIIVDKFGVDREQIQPEAVLEDIELDSIALVEVVLTAQKQTGAQIPTDDLKSSGTVAELYETVSAAL